MVDSKIESFGKRIHKLAKMQGISQKELSKKVGCTETAMTRYWKIQSQYP